MKPEELYLLMPTNSLLYLCMPTLPIYILSLLFIIRKYCTKVHARGALSVPLWIISYIRKGTKPIPFGTPLGSELTLPCRVV
uniref:Uncharacterized protein n=1 Tax=Picea glauca TaxID=3330 RepID=A0A101LU70_PICGL|nr:hypothetical protein ABT39_MTgene3388 [Picea glauca]KUM45461.1 hypothetical protein ABT39_MTgene2563 [Picea glauca]KUM45472.1 hypothetical protein ABT39_MTgene2574 [Picea glauca]QHR89003.1 hypothetical protein Q903MT_gene3022 [Picea sitchensis]